MPFETKPIGVAYKDPLLSSINIVSTATTLTLTEAGAFSLTTSDQSLTWDANGAPVLTRELVGGDSGRAFELDVEVLAGNGMRQGALAIGMSRASGQDFTWDGNPDAAMKIGATNRAANADNEGAVRGIDISARNRGTNVSWVNGVNIGTRNDSGSIAYNLKGLDIRMEVYGTVKTEIVGIDVNMSVENDTDSPDTVGIRIRNTDQSAQDAVGSAIQLSNTSTNGFTNLFDFDGLTAGADTVLVSDGGSAASTFAARLRVVTPDGNAGWINVYSTSNDA